MSQPIAQTITLRVPNIGDYKEVPVIEVFIKPGDVIEKEAPLLTLESDKATIDVPSTAAGTVAQLLIKVGDTVSEGSVIAHLTPASEQVPTAEVNQENQALAQVKHVQQPIASATPAKQSITLTVPNIGDYKNVPIIDVLVNIGDILQQDTPLVTLESDKATIDVPSTAAGVLSQLLIKVGDTVSEGSALAVLTMLPTTSVLETTVVDQKISAQQSVAESPIKTSASIPSVTNTNLEIARSSESQTTPLATTQTIHASPSVRKFSREFGVDLAQVSGTGPKGRITKSDIQQFIKAAMTNSVSGTAKVTTDAANLSLLPWPKIDFAQFGSIEKKPLSRIKKISGANLHRNWVRIPHVTNHEEADITELEQFRILLNQERRTPEIKVTLLAFLIKICAAALKQFPLFNTSLEETPEGPGLVFKHYIHIGFAADTPNGLVVPVLKNVDQKGIFEIAVETTELALLARQGKLKPEQMQGGCFSISSLGSIGGVSFSPIINAPEVAILGISRSALRPIWQNEQFVARLILPLSLSYDHRVIDGAQAARFNVYLSQLLTDFRRIAL